MSACSVMYVGTLNISAARDNIGCDFYDNRSNEEVMTMMQSNWMGGWGGPWMILVVILVIVGIVLTRENNDKKNSHVRKRIRTP